MSTSFCKNIIKLLTFFEFTVERFNTKRLLSRFSTPFYAFALQKTWLLNAFPL